MIGMPSESEIRTAIWQLKSHAGKFQVLAECVVRIKHGGPYLDLVPQGRNSALQTTIGYPDAYAQGHSSELYLVETTVGDWRKHLDTEDIPGIEKLVKAGRKVAAFTLFCMADSDLLIAQDRKELKERKKPKIKKMSAEEYKVAIEALGVPKGGVQIFFLDQLVKELRHPAYARVLAEYGLPIDISPFYPIANRLFTAFGGPTREDYENGLAVAKFRHEEVKRALSPSARLLVEAGSGLGKTTLATAVAFDWLKGSSQGAFYVDLDVYDDPAVMVPQLIQQLKQYGCKEHLFILDNCHRLKPALLRQVIGAHVDPSNRPTILALSRMLDDQQARTLCKDTGTQRLQISLCEDDIRAVYELIARRLSATGSYLSPSEADVRKWLTLHADLVSFSLALNGAAASILAGQKPTLTEQDAIDHLRVRYISDLADEEREMLAVIALCARFDIAASSSSLLRGVPKQSIERGLVFEHTARNRQRRYGLAHARFGHLLLRALDKDEDEVWRSVIKRDSFQACFISLRLLQSDIEAMAPEKAMAKAREVLQSVGPDAWKFSSHFSPGYSGVIASLYKAVGLEATFKGTLMNEISQYIAKQDGFLTGLPSFLTFAEQEGFDSEVEKVWADLLLAVEAGRMTAAACLAPVATVQNMLRMAAARGTATLLAFANSFENDAVANAVANKFAKLMPDLAEGVLADFSKFAPTLHALLLQKLKAGTILETFKISMLKAKSRGSIRLWLRRTQLLGLLAPDAVPAWLAERGGVVTQLLLGEPDSTRASLEPQAKALIQRWADEGAAGQTSASIASKLYCMVCLADSQHVATVNHFIVSMNSDLLTECLEVQNAPLLGRLLVAMSPEFDNTPGAAVLASGIAKITEERILQATECKNGKSPNSHYLAMNVAVAKLSGATGEEVWLRHAIAMVLENPVRLAPYDSTVRIADQAGRIDRTFRDQVEAVLKLSKEEQTSV